MLANAVRWYILLAGAKDPRLFLDHGQIVFTGRMSPTSCRRRSARYVRFVGLMHLTKDRAVALASVVLDR